MQANMCNQNRRPPRPRIIIIVGGVEGAAFYLVLPMIWTLDSFWLRFEVALV